jgi:rhodanese-related sulfurtransferase
MKQHIDKKKAQNLVAKGAMLIDVRDPVAFRDGTIPGAVNISLRRISELVKQPKNRCMILFGTSNDDDTLASALGYVRQFGFDK